MCEEGSTDITGREGSEGKKKKRLTLDRKRRGSSLGEATGLVTGSPGMAYWGSAGNLQKNLAGDTGNSKRG